MKRILSALLVSAAISAPAFAAGSSNSNVEVNYGLDLNGVIGIQGDLDISSAVGAPISAELVYKSYSQDFVFFGQGYSWSYTGLGVAGILDLRSAIKMPPEFRPYVGIGLMHLSATYSGPGGAATLTSPNSGGIYITGGVKYMVTPQVAADLNYNNFGGLTVGAAFYF